MTDFFSFFDIPIFLVLILSFIFNSNNGSNQISHHEEVAKIEESTTPPKEENANEVSTEDIVVPPPESFGNDDNAEAQQNNIPIPAPPDVTGATASHQPDLIQDVASKQAPGIIIFN